MGSLVINGDRPLRKTLKELGVKNRALCGHLDFYGSYGKYYGNYRTIILNGDGNAMNLEEISTIHKGLFRQCPGLKK
jgi:hypothetical protein